MNKVLLLITLSILGACSEQANVGGPSGPNTAPTETADEFIARVNAEYKEQWREKHTAEWVYTTYITVDSAHTFSLANERFAAWRSRMVKESLAYADQEVSAETRRALDFLKLGALLVAPDDDAKRKEQAQILAELKGAYGAGKYCRSDAECFGGQALENLMEQTRDYDELLEYWIGWRGISPPMRDQYERYAELANEGANELGYGDLGEMWRSGFDMTATEFQTETGRLLGEGDRPRARELFGLALTMAACLGVGMIAVGLAVVSPAATFMGAQGEVHDDAVTYLGIRVLGAPAVLITITCFGALRGLQDMRTPMGIALGINLLNILLDAVLIFGAGPIPALGIAGAAWASVASQYLGMFWSLLAVRSRLGLPSRLHTRDARKILVIAGDLFLRTGLLTGFMLLGTRAATLMGEDQAAAHQAVRSVWLFTAFALDAFALTAQSLTSYFLGARRPDAALSVARVSCFWGLLTGVVLTFAMLGGQGLVEDLLVPPAALHAFAVAWLVAALAQPLNAVSFVTDGIHWGTGDFRYLRNAMFLATTCGAAAIYFMDESKPDALTTLWIITAGWIAIRSVFGVIRVWPGIGASPLRRSW